METSDRFAARRGHAAVLGSGMAGLAAAGVLARRCEKVTVYERDVEPEPAPRKGVPQGAHAHILLKAGETALEEIFPGLTRELDARGSLPIDFGTDMGWFHHGAWKARYAGGLTIRMQSRPFLESVIRERLAALGNVAFRYRTAVTGLRIEAGRADAVLVRPAEPTGEPKAEAADLIVDATGRGSTLPPMLAEEYGAPPEIRLPIDLQYASRVYRARPDAGRTWRALLVYHAPPAERRIGLIFPIEGDRWVVTLGGYMGDHPPSAEAAWLDFARSLAQPALYEAVKDAEPLSDIRTFRFPDARWTRYDRLRRFPAGLLPLGDSVCSFDPVFGQGMSVAAQGALLLADHLDRDPTAERPLRYLRSLAGKVFVPWLLLSSEDLRYPTLKADRPFWMPWLQRYTRRVFALSSTNASDYDRLLRVLHLLKGPELLFHPVTLLRAVSR
jgi:2-polyprenyl-6-methoxyphenol hydroxylase-like FAD-dependent oxidoreductase